MHAGDASELEAAELSIGWADRSGVSGREEVDGGACSRPERLPCVLGDRRSCCFGSELLRHTAAGGPCEEEVKEAVL